MSEMSTEELLSRGRDREAVDRMAATLEALAQTRPGGNDMDGVQQLDEVMPLLRAVVAGITPAQYDDPTPCTAFTVRDVLEHMIGGATAFAPAFRGGPSPHTVPDEGDAVERWTAAMAELLAAVHSEGATTRMISSPFGVVDGGFFARYVAFDGLMHAWDLGQATGTEVLAGGDLVAAVDRFARDLLVPEMRDGDTFAAEVEPAKDAGLLDSLAAFSGRRRQGATTT